MTDVFISYSRKDKEFVGRLHEALKARGRDTWIDWHDIPPSAVWFQEIRSAIEAADAILFVISPKSTVSEVCSSEITHAIQNNKRIVPILREEVDSKALPAARMTR